MQKNIQDYDKIFEDDKLNIKQLVIDFAHLIEQDTYMENEVSKVYSISAEFGIGKTFFCEKLQSVLKADNIQTIKMNIWEMDFYKNPLMPILAKLNETYSKDGRNLPDKIIDFTVDISKKLLLTVGEVGARAVSQTVLNNDVVDICKQRFSSHNLYDDFKNYELALNELKQSLISWAKNSVTPIVIIIDELDRCRPDYAVKTLEVLKHFFDVSGFVFVLAIDEKQLENSVKNLYGAINFDGYKRKFINNTFSLPIPDRKSFVDFLYDKLDMENLIKKIENDNRDLVFKIRIDDYKDMIDREFMGIQNKNEVAQKKDFNNWQTPISIIKKYFTAYSNLFNFTLRQMEQTFDRLCMFVKAISASKELFSPDLTVLLVCLHEYDIKIYNYFRNYKGKVIEELCSQISKNKDYIDEKEIIFDRNYIPKTPYVLGYSVDEIPSSNNIRVVIEDNVDRFFIERSVEEHPLKWIAEVDEYNIGRNAILNNQRIALITYSQQNSQWKETKPDIRTIDKFNLNKFKKSYFEKVDFISHFD